LQGNLKNNEESLRKHIFFILHTGRNVRGHWSLNCSCNHIYGVCFLKKRDYAFYSHVVFFLSFLWFTQNAVIISQHCTDQLLSAGKESFMLSICSTSFYGTKN
jgi:hypothetical protein